MVSKVVKMIEDGCHLDIIVKETGLTPSGICDLLHQTSDQHHIHVIQQFIQGLDDYTAL